VTWIVFSLQTFVEVVVVERLTRIGIVSMITEVQETITGVLEDLKAGPAQ
jgi:hypothetical protein